MGKCIKCSKETKNQYICYSADIVGKSVEKSYATKTTTTKYSNFKLHKGYLCNECIYTTWTMTLSLVMSIVLLFTGIGLLLLIILNIREFFDPFSAVIFFPLSFALLSFIGSYILFQSYLLATKERKTDNVKNDDSKYYSGSFALVKIMQKQNPRKAYFTPSAYASLKKY